MHTDKALTGGEVTRIVRRLRSGTPSARVVFVANQPKSEVVLTNVLACGADAVFHGRVHIDELLERIDEIMSGECD